MSMQKTKSLSQLEMKMKLKSLRRHVEIVSQSVRKASCIILPNLHLCSGFFSSLHLFVSLPCLFMTFYSLLMSVS